MLRQHIKDRHYPYPQHQTGEVVIANYGNYLEQDHGYDRKPRPAILLLASDPQHLFAGLTTKPQYRTSGVARPVLPKPACTGLDDKVSHLWSTRPAFVCRLDVYKHLGWVDRELVLFLADHMHLDRYTLAMLWHAARIHGDGPPRKPR
jgi:hypothetical protein